MLEAVFVKSENEKDGKSALVCNPESTTATPTPLPVMEEFVRPSVASITSSIGLLTEPVGGGAAVERTMWSSEIWATVGSDSSELTFDFDNFTVIALMNTCSAAIGLPVARTLPRTVVYFAGAASTITLTKLVSVACASAKLPAKSCGGLKLAEAVGVRVRRSPGQRSQT